MFLVSGVVDGARICLAVSRGLRLCSTREVGGGSLVSEVRVDTIWMNAGGQGAQ